MAVLASALAPIQLATPAHAAPTSEDYDSVVKRLEQARKLVKESEARQRDLKSRINQTAAQKEAIETELEELQAVVDQAQGRLNLATGDLNSVQDELQRKTAELQVLLQDLQDAHGMIQGRARAMYKQGPASVIEFILGSESFSDFAGRLQVVSHLFRADKRNLDLISTAKDKVTEERDHISELRQQAAQQADALQSNRDKVAATRNAVDSRKRALNSELSSLGGALSATERDKQKYLAEQKQLERESAQIKAFLKGKNGGTAAVGPGGMIWPVSGPVTSGYGYRTHPIYGTKRFHAGIDIAASTGTGIKSAADGVVIFAGSKGAYGNAIIVDHGGGLATLYAHLSGFVAGNGAKVSRGTVIGRAGCTGACTGPHLHFEVRLNGEPQNPMKWLP